MTNNVFFSIICPAFNSEKTIIRTIDSLLIQKYTKWELIIIDDGSKNPLSNFINVKDKRIKLLRQKEKGPFISRQEGLKKAKGNYILFIDADDSFTNDALTICYNEIKKEDADIYLFGANKVMEDGSIEPCFNHTSNFNLIKDKNQIISDAFISRTMMQALWAKCFKASLFKDYQFPDFKKIVFPGEDNTFLSEPIFNAKTIKYINNIIYNYNYLSFSSSHKKNSLTFEKDNISIHYNFLYLRINENGNSDIISKKYLSSTSRDFIIFLKLCKKDLNYSDFKKELAHFRNYRFIQDMIKNKIYPTMKIKILFLFLRLKMEWFFYISL